MWPAVPIPMPKSRLFSPGDFTILKRLDIRLIKPAENKLVLHVVQRIVSCTLRSVSHTVQRPDQHKSPNVTEARQVIENRHRCKQYCFKTSPPASIISARRNK